GIDDDLAIDPEHLALPVSIGGDLVMMVAGMSAGQQILAAVLDPAHGVIEFERQRREDDLLGIKPRLRAKPATDIGRDDPDAALLDPEDLAERDPHRVRRLRRGIDDNLVEPVVAIGQDGAAFQRRAGLPVHAVFAGDGDFRRARRGLDITALDHPFEIEVVAPALMHDMAAAGQTDIRHELAAAVEMPRILAPQYRRADPARCRAVGRAHDPLPCAAPWAATVFAASAIALTMFVYPVQRHRLPASPWRISASEPARPRWIRSRALISMPGVQKPHCTACRRWKLSRSAAMTGSSRKPSSEWIWRSSQAAASIRQARAGMPSTRTVQAPHTPCSQPRCVAVRLCRSRSRSASDRRGATSSEKSGALRRNGDGVVRRPPSRVRGRGV